MILARFRGFPSGKYFLGCVGQVICKCKTSHILVELFQDRVLVLPVIHKGVVNHIVEFGVVEKTICWAELVGGGERVAELERRSNSRTCRATALTRQQAYTNNSGVILQIPKSSANILGILLFMRNESDELKRRDSSVCREVSNLRHLFQLQCCVPAQLVQL